MSVSKGGGNVLESELGERIPVKSPVPTAPSVTVRVPFATARQASIAFTSLAVDPEPPRSRVRRQLSLASADNEAAPTAATSDTATAGTGTSAGAGTGTGRVLVATFTAFDDAAADEQSAPVGHGSVQTQKLDSLLKSLKVSVNSFMEHVELIVKTIQTFDTLDPNQTAKSS